MIPQIPDNIYKLLIVVGFFMFGYSYLESQKEYSKHEKLYDEYSFLSDSIENFRNNLDYQRKQLVEEADALSSRNGYKSPIKETDTTIMFTRIISGNPMEMAVNDKIRELYNSYKKQTFMYKRGIISLEKKGQTYLDALADYKEISLLQKSCGVLGAILAFVGFMGLVNLHDLNSAKHKHDLKLSMGHVRCQSCARKFTSLIKYGSEADETLNKSYCQSCYQKGSFIERDLTAEEAYNKAIFNYGTNKNWLKKKNFKSMFFNLDRWNKNLY